MNNGVITGVGAVVANDLSFTMIVDVNHAASIWKIGYGIAGLEVFHPNINYETCCMQDVKEHPQ
jgi:hypothetical protein